MDTGSSVSIISSNFFDNNKKNLKYKHLSRAVKISTINSTVKFMGCIDLSFKIKTAHFRHPMYICNFGDEAIFEGLLGFDFIRKFNLVIVPDIECCKINNIYIPFTNRKSNFHIVETQCKTNESTHHHNIKTSDLSKYVNVPPFVPTQFQGLSTSQKNVNVSLAQKCVLQPKDSSYIKVKSSFMDMSFFNENLVFISSCMNDNLNIQDAVLSFAATPRDTSKLTSTNKGTVSFYIYVENLSSNPMHINKNTKFGHLFKIDDIKENPNVNSNNQYDLEYFANIIKTISDILNKRKDEFSKNKIKMSHLPQH